MEYFVAAICDPNSGVIDTSKIDSIIQEFYTVGQLIQVGMFDSTSTVVQFSAFAVQNTVTGLLPTTPTNGSAFVGVVVRDPSPVPDPDWYFDYVRPEPHAYDALDPYKAFPCRVQVRIVPDVTTIQIPEVTIGMRYEVDRSIDQIEPPTSLPVLPRWTFGRFSHNFVNFCAINQGEVSANAHEQPLYTQVLNNVTYVSNLNFTGSALLDIKNTTIIGF